MDPNKSPLGQTAQYPQTYTSEPLHAIARADSRSALLRGNPLPFHGVDFWNAWEMTWLARGGQPQVATVQICVAADSVALIESKSLKLYLGSFAMSEFASSATVAATIEKDLESCADGDVQVMVTTIADDADAGFGDLEGHCIDDASIDCDTWHVDPELLRLESPVVVQESLVTHTMRSLCPVTGQPDNASVQIRYRGAKIDRDSLLRYIVSFRLHNDFHEACVERMFVDIKKRCDCEQLSVYARFQRRGGIDINPFRSNFEAPPENLRLWRQ